MANGHSSNSCSPSVCLSVCRSVGLSVPFVTSIDHFAACRSLFHQQLFGVQAVQGQCAETKDTGTLDEADDEGGH